MESRKKLMNERKELMNEFRKAATKNDKDAARKKLLNNMKKWASSIFGIEVKTGSVLLVSIAIVLSICSGSTCLVSKHNDFICSTITT